VDVVVELLEEKEIGDYLVEIGGEIRTGGLSPAGKNWRIGINTPEKTAALDDIFAIVEISDRAVATSGNYRNYIESGDESWAHIMDPREGRPVLSDILSSTVLAEDCLTADALATAAIVSGKAAAILLFEKFPVEWYLVFRDKNGELSSVHSDGFVLQEVSK
jgi:thiamine biosynthesis lipoprotein